MVKRDVMVSVHWTLGVRVSKGILDENTMLVHETNLFGSIVKTYAVKLEHIIPERKYFNMYLVEHVHVCLNSSKSMGFDKSDKKFIFEVSTGKDDEKTSHEIDGFSFAPDTSADYDQKLKDTLNEEMQGNYYRIPHIKLDIAQIGGVLMVGMSIGIMAYKIAMNFGIML